MVNPTFDPRQWALPGKIQHFLLWLVLAGYKVSRFKNEPLIFNVERPGGGKYQVYGTVPLPYRDQKTLARAWEFERATWFITPVPKFGYWKYVFEMDGEPIENFIRTALTTQPVKKVND